MTEADWNEDHGQALRSRRQQRGLTQEALAEAADVAVATIKNLERGARQPRASTLRLIADALDCSLGELRLGQQLPSIAVLPFTNLSEDEEQEPLCNGLAEELINALAQLPGLKVAARTSSFYFKNKDVDLHTIGETLGVQHILEGGVQRSGDQLRITAQLIQIDDGFHIWSERFDRQFTDIFTIQDEIVTNVIRKLSIELLGETAPTLIEAPTHDLVAYELFLKGTYLIMQTTPTSFQQGFECLQHAIDRDPEFAPAHAWIASAYLYQTLWEMTRPLDKLPLARAAAERALKIDDSLGLAHAMVGAVKQVLDWDWVGARESYDRAMALDPANSQIRVLNGSYLMTVGRLQEAVEGAKHAMEVDPLSAGAAHNAGAWLILANRLDEAEAALKTALAIEPHGGQIHVALAACLSRRPDQKREVLVEHLTRGVDLSNRSPLAIALAARVYFTVGLETEANEILTELYARAQEGECISSYWLARIHAVMGNADRTFECLDNALNERDAFLHWMPNDFAFDSLRSDSRYARLIDRMGLTRYVS